MFITEEYIEENKTDKGAWTKSQLLAIGVSWPPVSGWKRRSIGRWITKEADERFQAKITAKHRKGEDFLNAARSRMARLTDKELDMLQKIVIDEQNKRYQED